MGSSIASAVPGFFEALPGVRTAIGINNVIVGLIVAGAVGGFPTAIIVPIVISAACAIANGLSYFIYYTDYPLLNKAVASPFADLIWLIEIAGLNFYSYIILINVLRGSERMVFMTVFWTLMLVITVFRLVILAFRIRFILDDNHTPDLKLTLAYLHIGFFAGVALVECASAVFLLRKFQRACRSSKIFVLRGGKLFRYMLRSTEIRVATLAIIGTIRAVTYPLEFSIKSNVAAQLNRFAATLECLFPVVLFIDVLASRLVFAQENSPGNSIPTGSGTAYSSTTPRSRELYHSGT